jgi:hypothetical protein
MGIFSPELVPPAYPNSGCYNSTTWDMVRAFGAAIPSRFQ